MRTSIWLFPDRSVEEMVAAARCAEAAGIDVFWLGDEGVAREPFTTLAAIGAATDRIELGVAAVNPYLRHPALSASTAATLAEATGRLVHLAFARGGRASLAPLGITSEHPIQDLGDAIRVARAVLAGQPTEGFVPGPYARAETRVDLWLAGRGLPVAELAGRTADGFFANLAKPLLETAVARVRSGGPARVSLSLPLILDDAQREGIRPYLTLALLDAPPGTPEAAGISRRAAEEAAEAVGRGEIETAARLVTDRVVENMTIDAEPAAAARELAGWAHRLGADEIGAAVWGDDLAREVGRSAEVLLQAVREA